MYRLVALKPFSLLLLCPICWMDSCWLPLCAAWCVCLTRWRRHSQCSTSVGGDSEQNMVLFEIKTLIISPECVHLQLLTIISCTFLKKNIIYMQNVYSVLIYITDIIKFETPKQATCCTDKSICCLHQMFCFMFHKKIKWLSHNIYNILQDKKNKKQMLAWKHEFLLCTIAAF